MRFNIFSFCILIFSNYVFCQNVDVNYDIKIKSDIFDFKKYNESDSPNYLKSIYVQAQKDINNYPIEFIATKNGYSIDFSNSLQVDREMQKIPVSKFMVLGFIGLDISMYYDGQYIYSDNNNEIIKVYDLKKLSSWRITNKKKEILGYSCYKANFTSDVPEVRRAALMMPKHAWFTNEIPISGGPTIFGNLPGLILELETKAAHFVATSIQKTNRELKKIDLKGRKVMSFIESERYHNDMMEDIIKN